MDDENEREMATGEKKVAHHTHGVVSALAVFFVASACLAGSNATTAGATTITPAGPSTLTNSGPVTASANGQVIENLRITSGTGKNGITVIGKSNVIIRNVEIHHTGGRGIYVGDSSGTQISNVKVLYENAPARGKHSSYEFYNIECYNSTGFQVTNAQVRRGSTGILTVQCPAAQLSFIEGYDFRGPFPRGQIVQFGWSPNSVLTDFYNRNPLNTAWTEDNVNIYHSDNVTIRRGLIDGNNSPSGVGVIVETENVSTASLVEDVDTIRMGNGAFSASSATSDGSASTFRRVRSRENVCGRLGNRRPASLSNSLMFHSWNGAMGTRFEQAQYWASCNGNIAWDPNTMAVKDFTQVNYTQREPLYIIFSWE